MQPFTINEPEREAPDRPPLPCGFVLRAKHSRYQHRDAVAIKSRVKGLLCDSYAVVVQDFRNPQLQKWVVQTPKPSEQSLEVEFNDLVEKWRLETGMESVTSRRYSHPAYHAILLLGSDAVPLILRELSNRPDRWFEALKFLTREYDVVPKGASFEQAVQAWLAWGRQRGYTC